MTLALSVLSVVLLGADRPGCKDNPLFARPAKTTLVECSTAYDEAELPLDKVGKLFERRVGRVTHLKYVHPEGESVEGLLTTYRKALGEGGFSLPYDGETETGRVLTALRAQPVPAALSATIEPVSDTRVATRVELVEQAEAPGPLSKSARPPKGQRDAPGCTDPLGLGRPEGAFIDRCDKGRDDEVELGGTGEQKSLRGFVTRARYTGPSAQTPVEVIARFKASLVAAGFEVVREETDGAERILQARRTAGEKTEWAVVTAGEAKVNAGTVVHTYVTRLVPHAP